MKTEFIGITRSLAIGGATDFSFVDEESKWRGSEVHRMIQLFDECKLEERTVPNEMRGYLNAHKKFRAETGFIAQLIEHKVQSKDFRIRGRIDRMGLMKGKPSIVDFKTGAIDPAVALQLCLGGFLLDPTKWFHRYAVRLKPDGNYSITPFKLIDWGSDLATALAFVRASQWKSQHKKV